MKNHLNKKQRTLSIIALLSAAMGIAGCDTWDDKIYDEFYDKNTDVGIIQCDNIRALILPDGSEIICTNTECNNFKVKIINPVTQNIIDPNLINSCQKEDASDLNNRTIICTNITSLANAKYADSLHYKLCLPNNQCKENEKLFDDSNGTACVSSILEKADRVLCGEGYIDPLKDSTYCGASGDCKGDNKGEDCSLIKGICSEGKCICDTDADMSMCTDGRHTCVNLSKRNILQDDQYCAKDATQCDETIDCTADGKICFEGECIKNICNTGEKTCRVGNGTMCLDITLNALNCGECDYKCSDHAIPDATSNTCSEGKCQYTCTTGYVNVGSGITADTILCIDPKTNNTYCGATGNASGAASDSQIGTPCTDGTVCVDSKCLTNSCPKEEEPDKPNLCVVNSQNTCQNINSNDENHCGACNYKCSDHGVQNATSDTCIEGNCQYTCATGYVNVGSGNTSQSIKCIDPKSDNSYCGAKSSEEQGESCTGGMVCVDSHCVTNSCTDTTKPNLCVMNGQNTCLNINSNDANHCGACNYKCSDHAIPNATSDTCSDGNCQYTCTGGYVNVGNGNTAQTIKCIDPNSDNNYCGATSASSTGAQCTGGKVCVNKKCEFNSCTDSSKPNLCVVNGNNTCQNINSTDANHCGACNYKCADHAIPNATSSECKNGSCQYTCAAGYVNVGTGITANTILCIDPKTNNTYCNATGNASGAANTSQKGTSCTGGTVCVNGSCETNSCTDSSKPNLCVVNGQNTCQNINSTDANHCGACNYKCSDHAIPNATSSTCKNGDCQYACAAGYVNVGTGITANTILCIDPKSNNTYCNATGNASGAASTSQKGTSCNGGTVCVNGSCETNSCTDSSKPNLCVVNGQNTCQNINSTDANHCGACNYKCSDHAIPNATSSACKNGDCQYTCASGYVNVGTGITANTILCIDPKTNNTYCNATGNASGAANTSQKGTSCTGGTVCVNGSCETNSCTDSSKPNLCVVNGQNTCQNINSTDANHCGACNYKCSDHAIPNATSSTCKNGDCQYACAADYVNVGTGITANTILCIDPKSNNTYCNATGNATGAASTSQKGTSCNGGTVCVNGSCETNSCTDSSKPNLCVVNGQNTCQNINSTDANHCGACNYKCSDHAIPNATSSACKNGECQYTCASGYVNVGTGITANTILCIDPKSNNTYCNATGNATGAASTSQKGTSCTGGTVCVDGSCVIAGCTSTQITCPGFGCQEKAYLEYLHRIADDESANKCKCESNYEGEDNTLTMCTLTGCDPACNAPTPICSQDTHTCVECLEYTDCTTTDKPLCNQSTHACEACPTHSTWNNSTNLCECPLGSHMSTENNSCICDNDYTDCSAPDSFKCLKRGSGWGSGSSGNATWTSSCAEKCVSCENGQTCNRTGNSSNYAYTCN